ncbi:MAG: hypothetical protein JWM16_3077 [Verrucomicrobiales bacterium]|nr:hypothetical protein [Verrucomicrobiales bacterium]
MEQAFFRPVQKQCRAKKRQKKQAASYGFMPIGMRCFHTHMDCHGFDIKATAFPPRKRCCRSKNIGGVLFAAALFEFLAAAARTGIIPPNLRADITGRFGFGHSLIRFTHQVTPLPGGSSGGGLVGG